jgi:hypothetical protein
MNNNPLQNKTDLSHIKNPEDLLLEIKQVRRRVKLREAELKFGLKQIPHEVVHSTLNSVVPAFLRNSVTNKSLSILQGLITMILGNVLSKSGKGNMKTGLVNAAKQFGFLAAIESIGIFFKKKRKNKVVQETTVK